MSKDEIVAEAVRQQKEFDEELENKGVTKLKTSLCKKFTIAELTNGEEGIRTLYNYNLEYYFDEIDIFAQFIFVLKRKVNEHHDKGNADMEQLYQNLFDKAFQFMNEYYYDDELNYILELLN